MSFKSHFRERWDAHYTRCKLRTDPLYPAVLTELQGSGLPLLDIGCGLGLLAFFLRDHGLTTPIRALDYDQRKILAARARAEKYPGHDLEFAWVDARHGLPGHQGNVAILDILQFFTPPQRDRLLQRALERVAPGGKLVLRTCLRDRSWRYRVTVAGDTLAKMTRWMKAPPVHYPERDDFTRLLSPLGRLHIRPLWGSTPFNNYLVVWERPA